MHRSQIFRALIFSGLLFGFLSAGAAQKNKVDVFVEFQKKISELESSLKKESDIRKRYDLFLTRYLGLSELRAKNPRQSETNELNMSMFMETLSYLPEKKNFQAPKCKEYKKEVSAMMKSYDEKQKEPFVEKALSVIELICR